MATEETEIAVLKTQMKNINDKLDAIDEKNSKEHSELKSELKEFIKEAVATRASKWVEWAVTVAIGAGITAAVYQIFK